MSPNKRWTDFRQFPTASLDGEIWIQCHLKLTFQFQGRHGISLHLCDPSRRCLRIGLEEILDHQSGRAIYDAMLKLEIEEQFQDKYLKQLADMDQLDTDVAERLAFNIAMDGYWGRIEQSALNYCESEAAMNGEVPPETPPRTA